MASTATNWVLLLASGMLVGAAAAAPPPAPALSPFGNQPIVLDAASSEVDLANSTGVFNRITITQGDLRVQADRARGSYPVDFKNSHWTFEGNVRIDAEQRGNLRADQAVVDFRNGQIERATATGKPAEFEQKRSETGALARGRANQIQYDVNEGSVRLLEDAWLSDGQNEISGPLLVYNIRAQRVQAATTPGTDQRVHIVITPQGSGGAAKSTPSPTSPSTPSPSTPAKPPPNSPP
jgi:lipopolysaccharide transport protein LptA